ncbi:serine/threonine-protein kinase [Pseudofrankia sp. DC12]|uniref:serine/threonine-protein kinase n=1 Tax=Pseudofrankia sp. DC12 TaxID=683315 RepID=UPI0006961B5D|nr:serine/threonine-protein kinase [Pseudofrankia sp. DC12]
MTDPHTTESANAPDERIRLAGRYRVDGLLGSGGMSEVFYGYDERLDRPVAIKLLRPPGSPPGPPGSPERLTFDEQQAITQKRFLREIRTTAGLEHPGIPAVFDTGVHTFPDGSRRIWLVMQLLRGSTVETLIESADYEKAPLGIAQAAGVTAQVAAVLASVHAVDIVHRDIKPANLMLVPGGFVKVLDFGIAILRGADAPPRLTQVDHTIGTPDYMSPEQHLGSVITTASDIYSLGCLLFGLLTGERVFYGTGSGESLRSLHVQAAPPSVQADPQAALDRLRAYLDHVDPAAEDPCASSKLAVPRRSCSPPPARRRRRWPPSPAFARPWPWPTAHPPTPSSRTSTRSSTVSVRPNAGPDQVALFDRLASVSLRNPYTG